MPSGTRIAAKGAISSFPSPTIKMLWVSGGMRRSKIDPCATKGTL